MTPIEDDTFNSALDEIKVTGTCDAGCGKLATEWFGDTACATCGERACVNVLQDSYDREGERPAGVRLHSALATAQERIRELEDVVRENHEWHLTYDMHDGYPGSALEQTNLRVLGHTQTIPGDSVKAIVTQRLEDQLRQFRQCLPTDSAGSALLHALLCLGALHTLHKHDLLNTAEHDLYREHIRNQFSAYHPADIARLDAEIAKREPKDTPT